MDQKIPFTSYDFWGYLSAGFLLLFVADYVAGTGLLALESWTVVQGIVAVSSAYVAGQLVAGLSSAALEKYLVGKLFGYPHKVLFDQAKAWPWVRSLIPGYFRSLPPETQAAILERSAFDGVKEPSEALFLVAHANVRTIPAVMGRLDNFLNLYGFCRNAALVAFFDGALLYWSYWYGKGGTHDLYLSWIAIIVGIGMTLRYLKFYRLYSAEVFTAYAYKDPQ